MTNTQAKRILLMYIRMSEDTIINMGIDKFDRFHALWRKAIMVATLNKNKNK